MVANACAAIPVDARALARALERPAWLGIVPVVLRLPGSATFPWGVATALRAQGLGARWRILLRESGLRRALRHGEIPLVVVGGWRPPWAHWLVVLAWDDDRGWGVADPAMPEGRMDWVSAPVFRGRWRRYGCLTVLVTISGPSPQGPGPAA
jgi:hypothetical protein